MGMNEETHSCSFTLPPLTLTAATLAGQPKAHWEICLPVSSGASQTMLNQPSPAGTLVAKNWRLAFLPQAEQAVSPIATHCLPACLPACPSVVCLFELHFTPLSFCFFLSLSVCPILLCASSVEESLPLDSIPMKLVTVPSDLEQLWLSS